MKYPKFLLTLHFDTGALCPASKQDRKITHAQVPVPSPPAGNAGLVHRIQQGAQVPSAKNSFGTPIFNPFTSFFKLNV